MINIDAVYILLFIGTVSKSSEEDKKIDVVVVALVLVYSEPLIKTLYIKGEKYE